MEDAAKQMCQYESLKKGSSQAPEKFAFQSRREWYCETDLLYGADGDTGSTRHYEMTVLDVWSDLIQNEGDNVGLHSQKQHITLADRLFVASRQVHPHFLQENKETGIGEKILKRHREENLDKHRLAD